ncbi:type IV pilus assembly protein PilM [Patescibacteria group bacterium]|nr:MAG: type IV pilus assembly protein PilM [Patescibacteria group bacterium]
MSLFGNLFGKRSGSFLGIDIGTSAVKVVQLRKKGSKAVLETYGELALGPYGGEDIGQATSLPTEKIIEALTDLMREKEVNLSTNLCGVAIPFASSLMSVIEMPMLSYKQLSTMIPLEARKYIPVPISEVTLDWSMVPRDEIEPLSSEGEGGKEHPSRIKMTDILLVAIHNETLGRYQEIIQKTGLQSKFFEIEIFSSLRAVLDNHKEPIMILDMGAATTKLYIVERGIVRFSHTVNRGSQDITSTISKSLGMSLSQAEVLKRTQGAQTLGGANVRDIIAVSLGYIFAETNQVLLNYEKKHQEAVAQVILVGGGSALRGITDLAKEALQTLVVPGNPFGKVETPAFLAQILRDTGPEFAVAVGLALRGLAEE